MTRVVAVDIGGTSTKIAVAGPDGSLEDPGSLPTTPELLEDLPDQIAARMDGGVSGIGVAVAGFVDDAQSAMIFNPNIAWLEGFPLRRSLEERFGVTVALDADSNAACLAEYHLGSGRGARRFFCLAIGTGVGGGMIIDGEVVRLAHGGLGDIGHVVVEPGGPSCGAGCRGCAEAMISAPAIEARDGRGRGAREIIEAAHTGEGHARNVLSETGRLLGIALASHAVILFPDVIAIAGGVAEAGDLILERARDVFQQTAGVFYRNGVRVEKATLGAQATLIGAALPFFSSGLGFPQVS
jgi:glucokinase